MTFSFAIDANMTDTCPQVDFYKTICWLVPKRIFWVKSVCRCEVHIDDVNIEIVRHPQGFICTFGKALVIGVRMDAAMIAINR